jgi:uncharacterized circularly permuted ATP-grasp superfamily protein
MALLDKYKPGDFFDEMFSAEGLVRPHYAALFERFQNLDQEEFEQRRTAVDAAFLRQGITFTVYSDEQGTERIFPFDLMPHPADAGVESLPQGHLFRPAHPQG